MSLLTNTAPALQQVSRLGETGLYTSENVTEQVFQRLSLSLSGDQVTRRGPFAEAIGSYATYDGTAAHRTTR